MAPLVLEVSAWAALVAGAAMGECGAVAEIPPAHRRRLPYFARSVLSCALPLVRACPRPIVYVSEQGDLASTVALLGDLARAEIPSPALFALSVHNGPVGALSLCAPARDHTALAGDDATLAAGLTETFARLATGDAPEMLLIYAEEALPEIYHSFERSTAPGVFLTLVLRLAATPGAEAVEISGGREGALALAHKLAAGARRVRFNAPALGSEPS